MSVASRHGSSPNTDAVPPLLRSSPSSTRIVVDLPAPLGPRKPWTSPVATSRSSPSSARKSPNALTRPEISIAGLLMLQRLHMIHEVVNGENRTAAARFVERFALLL